MLLAKISAAALALMIGIGPAVGENYTLACRFPQFPEVPYDASKPCAGAVTVTLEIERAAPGTYRITGAKTAALEKLACTRPVQDTLFDNADTITAQIVETTGYLRRIRLQGQLSATERYRIDVRRISRRIRKLAGVTYTEFDAVLVPGSASQLYKVAGINSLTGLCLLRRIR